MTSTGSAPSTASAAVAVAFVTPKVGGVYVPFIGGTRDPLLARSTSGTAGAALGAGAQPQQHSPKLGAYTRRYLSQEVPGIRHTCCMDKFIGVIIKTPLLQ